MPNWQFQTAHTQTAETIGTDDANNVATTTNVVSNADGSVLERLEYVQSAHVVPSADATTDALMRDVIGKKNDAAVTAVGTQKSLVAYLKGVLTWIGTLANTGGTATLGAMLGDFANVSLLTRLAAIHPAVATGTTDIDDSEQDESSAWFPLLTIAPAAGAPLRNVEVFIDLDKETTGFGTVESSATIQFRVARKIDGTNWRGAQTGSPADQLSAAISGTNASGSDMGVMLRPGFVGVTEAVRIEAKMSADATGDMELPYAVIYEGRAAPTITPVAAA